MYCSRTEHTAATDRDLAYETVGFPVLSVSSGCARCYGILDLVVQMRLTVRESGNEQGGTGPVTRTRDVADLSMRVRKVGNKDFWVCQSKCIVVI